MPTLKIEHVKVQMIDGDYATITGIEIIEPNPYCGFIQNDLGKPISSHWREDGAIRDNHPNHNLLIDDVEFRKLREAVARLRI